MKKIWYKVLLFFLVWGQKNLSMDKSVVEKSEEQNEKIEKNVSSAMEAGKERTGEVKSRLEVTGKFIVSEKIDSNISSEIFQNISKELEEQLKKLEQNVKKLSDVEAFIDHLKDFNESFKERFKRKSKKALNKMKDLSTAGWKTIKDNPRKTALAVAGVAALGGGGYFFREGISKHLGTVKDFSKKGWNMAKERGSSAWEYAREIPGKVKGKFKKG